MFAKIYIKLFWSNCVSEGEYVDKTIDCQKVLSCIYRMKREFGVNMIVDVLRGSSQRKVIQYGFDKLSTYGIMKNYSKEELSNFINTLIAHGYISLKEGEYPTVVLNPRSIKVLKGEEKVTLKEIVKAKKIILNNDLFENLRVLRREIADEESIPPYLIFPDTTLKELSSRCPVNFEQMLDVSGVGQLKLQKYGERFLEAIKNYMDENEVKPQWIFKNELKNDKNDKNAKSYKNLKLKTHEITAEMIKEHKNLEQIAKDRQITVSTVLSHITKYAEEKGVLDLNINFGGIFTDEEENQILKVTKKVGISKLKPIKEKLSEDISYDKIKAVILKDYILMDKNA